MISWIHISNFNELIRSKFIWLLLGLCFILFPPSYSYSAQVTLAWDAITESELAGYKIFCRQVGQNYYYNDPAWESYVEQLDNPDEPTCTMDNLDDNSIYYFVARAFDTWGNESYDSNEVCYQAPELIIDNGDSGTSFTGYWLISKGANPHGEKSLYSIGVWGSAGAIYSFEAAVNGSYEAYVWWTSVNSRCSSVPMEIYDGSTLLDVVYLNQKAGGGQWNVLGTYDFNGMARSVIVAEGSCTTCADAVRFVPISQLPEVIIDTGVAGTSFTGTWRISRGANPYGAKSLQCRQAGATYSFEAAVDGSYEASVRWTCLNSRCRSVSIKVYDGTALLLDHVYLNQKANGGQWNVLGTYDFSGTARVTIISKGRCTTCADAVRFVPVVW